mmetsp:Transcript_4468/g.12906  ORF Transcript_4468/g.12906 Transcript_4468/m.12906 type:complete len:296 (+) Transcript_4468:62-949(+)
MTGARSTERQDEWTHSPPGSRWRAARAPKLSISSSSSLRSLRRGAAEGEGRPLPWQGRRLRRARPCRSRARRCSLPGCGRIRPPEADGQLRAPRRREAPDGTAVRPSVPEAAWPRETRRRQRSAEQALQNVYRHRVPQLAAELEGGDHDLELRGVHALQAHHLRLEESAPAARHPMPGMPAACDARRHTRHPLGETRRAVAIDDHVLLRRIGALPPKDPLRLDDVLASVGLRHRGQGPGGDGPAGPLLQEALDRRAWDRLWEGEGTPVDVPPDAYDVGADTVMGDPVLLRVHQAD